MKLQVLMSTYNGERYLSEQIDSILSQTVFQNPDLETELIIRDDGSVDGTCGLLECYAEKFPQIKYHTGHNIGVIASFFELIQNTPEDVDFIALSDQDDVWMEDKLESAIDTLKDMDAEKPLLYCGMSQPTDENLNPVKGIFFTEDMRPSFGNALVENICTGATAVFNAKLAKYIKMEIPQYTAMHDWWLYILASCFGEVLFDPVSHMYYRQHSENVVGIRKGYVGEFVARVKRYRKNRYNISRQVRSLWDLIGHNHLEIQHEKEEIIKDILSARKKIKARICIVCNRKIYRQRKIDHFIFKCIFLTGKV